MDRARAVYVLEPVKNTRAPGPFVAVCEPTKYKIPVLAASAVDRELVIAIMAYFDVPERRWGAGPTCKYVAVDGPK